MKTKLLALALLAGGSLFAETHFSVGIGLGVPGYYAPPAVVYAPAPAPVVVQPAYPGPGYSWVNGYWSNGVWIGGYWAPPYRGYWGRRYYYGPRYYGPRRNWDRGRGWRR